jgi:hypothetical protein
MKKVRFQNYVYNLKKPFTDQLQVNKIGPKAIILI